MSSDERELVATGEEPSEDHHVGGVPRSEPQNLSEVLLQLFLRDSVRGPHHREQTQNEDDRKRRRS